MLWIAALWFKLAAGFQFDVNDLVPQPRFEVRISSELKEPFVPMIINGQTHKCHVPPSDEWTVRESAIEPSPAEILDAAHVIGGLRNCTYIAYDYWGYQLCHNGDIRQVHPEKEGTKLVFKDDSPSNFLGRKSDEYPSVVLRENTWQLKVPYAHGDVCDITGEPRKTNVFYVCDKDASQESIQDFNEVHICTYEFTIGSKKICDIFKPARELVNIIECYEDKPQEPELVEEPKIEHTQESTQGASLEGDASQGEASPVGPDEETEAIHSAPIDKPEQNQEDPVEPVEPVNPQEHEDL